MTKDSLLGGLVTKDGKDLQRLIRAIEGGLAAGNKSVKIEMPKLLPDKVTGRLREHDVTLTITTGHHETLVALECRDRSRPVGVNAVEEFSKKCEATGVHFGIIVASKGFCSTALTKAAFYNIGCMTLEQAESFDWCLAAGMTMHRRLLTHIPNITVYFPSNVKPPTETFQSEDGILFTKEMIRGWGMQALTQYKPMLTGELEAPGEYTKTLRDTDPDVYGILDGKRIKASCLTITIVYTVTEEFQPFSFRTYKDVGKSKDVTQAAVASMEVSKGKFADLVLSTNEQGQIAVSVVGRKEIEKLPRRERKRAISS